MQEANINTIPNTEKVEAGNTILSVTTTDDLTNIIGRLYIENFNSTKLLTSIGNKYNNALIKIDTLISEISKLKNDNIALSTSNSELAANNTRLDTRISTLNGIVETTIKQNIINVNNLESKYLATITRYKSTIDKLKKNSIKKTK